MEPVRPRQPSMSLPARLLNVFAVPGEVFEDVKASVPSLGNWLAPAVLYLLVGWVGAWLISSQPAIRQQQQEMADKMMDRMVEKGFISKEQAERQASANAVSSRIGVFFVPVMGAFVSPVLWALVLWGVGLRVFRAKFEFIKALEVAGLANTIAVLGDLVHTLLVVGMGNMFASASPALLLKDQDPQKMSFAVAAVLNVTTIWILIVRSIGLGRLCGVSVMRAAWWVIGLWLLWTTLMLGLAQMVMSLFRM